MDQITVTEIEALNNLRGDLEGESILVQDGIPFCKVIDMLGMFNSKGVLLENPIFTWEDVEFTRCIVSDYFYAKRNSNSADIKRRLVAVKLKPSVKVDKKFYYFTLTQSLFTEEFLELDEEARTKGEDLPTEAFWKEDYQIDIEATYVSLYKMTPQQMRKVGFDTKQNQCFYRIHPLVDYSKDPINQMDLVRTKIADMKARAEAARQKALEYNASKR